MKSLIHQSPEEQLAQNSQSTLSAIQENTATVTKVVKAVENLQKTQESDDTAVLGFTGTIKKLDEIKSGGLITNQELKKLNKKTPPTVQKVELMGAELVTIKGQKGDKGEKGDTVRGPKGDKGEKGDSVKGDKGDSGKDGKHGENGANGENGQDGTPGKDGNNGVDGSPDTADEVVDKVNTSSKLIDGERVRGFRELWNDFLQRGSFPLGKEAGGGGNVVRWLSNGVVVSAYVTEINFGSGLTPTYDGNGRISVTGSGGSATTYSETPSGAIDGVNKVYTTVHTINTIINFAINGAYIHPADYSVAGNTITFVTALDASLTGLPFTVVYQ